VGFEQGFHGLVREMRLEVRGEHEEEIVIEGDESLVEGGVVETVEGDAIADVEALAFVAAPWQDVGGDE
jgi:hypothetical protein